MKRATLLAAGFALLLATPSHAQPQHGFAAFGNLALPADFAHFPYANPNAPKGGTLSLVGTQAAYNANFRTFDSLNNFILKGSGAHGIHLLFDTLLTRSWDEPDATYGLLAQSVEWQPAANRVIFRLRTQARFHDATPLRADDAAFTLNLLKAKGHPLIRDVLRPMTRASVRQDGALVVALVPNAPRGTIGAIGQLPIFSRAFTERHPFEQSTLTPPMGSGPYRVGTLNAGRSITYARNPDYWGRNLNVNVGRHNFATIRYEYFRDDSAQFLAFQKGAYRFHEEFLSRRWARGYDFPAATDGRIQRLVLPDNRPSGAQGWFLNMRRAPLDNRKVRLALQYAFDFPWTNKILFHGLYTRTESFFDASPLKAPDAPPSAQVRALLAPFADTLPAGTLTTPPWRPPQADGSGRDRRMLSQAGRLLDAAGWRVVNGKRQNAQGEPLRLEFLLASASFERVVQPFARNLQTLGIDARLRRVDAAQYQRRLLDFDFDVAVSRFALSPLPGESVRSLWGSAQASTPGSRNLAGIQHPAVDALITTLVKAHTAEDLQTAAQALDIVLRAIVPWIPQWRKPSYNLAFWRDFDRPARPPLYHRGVVDLWYQATP